MAHDKEALVKPIFVKRKGSAIYEYWSGIYFYSVECFNLTRTGARKTVRIWKVEITDGTR
jgi:hypothetical protein